MHIITYVQIYKQIQYIKNIKPFYEDLHENITIKQLSGNMCSFTNIYINFLLSKLIVLQFLGLLSGLSVCFYIALDL